MFPVLIMLAIYNQIGKVIISVELAKGIASQLTVVNILEV